MNFASDDENAHPSFQAGMHAHAQAHMHMQQLQMLELKASMERLLDSLNAEQALGLAQMLTLFNDNPGYQHVVYGQLSSIMRLVHKICGTCGDTKHSTIEHLTAEVPAAVASQESKYEWLIGMSPADQIKRLNVTESIETPGEFICYTCQGNYSTLFARASAGRDCPRCVSRARVLENVPDENLGIGELHFRYRVAESPMIEDAYYCIDCFSHFPSLRHRMDQGLSCPVCAIQTEASRGGSSPI